MNKILQNFLNQISSKQEEDENLIALQKIIKYKFNNLSFLNAAISHTSLENSEDSPFERMEFLGDSILGLIVAEELFIKYPNYSEGQLSKLKSKLVSRRFLAMKAKQTGINEYIKLSEEAIQSGGKRSTSILGDSMEAIICAIYLDGEMEDVRNFINKIILKNSEKAVSKQDFRDYKSVLQEFTQRKFQNTPEYKIISEEGPEHDKTFTVEVYINNKQSGLGKGKNKKEAQQSAAKVACQNLNL
ncbi:MAG: ribonuclease III [Candidatus Cloacimonetes bacterium]|nr:ribonuclease III [Candidatus Cloacimonadota bacterium]MCF7815117.1 ribonuclease III [Candidatus Cloacimonadota bacterium]MCF7868604.1 ribonuclease III [Candidatus Cloacimonadota bacterium]MCF7882833.1 ribonuclease III [Candidatus Cloacimonadota bacterium]